MRRPARNNAAHGARRKVGTRKEFNLPLWLHRIKFARHGVSAVVDFFFASTPLLFLFFHSSEIIR